MHGQVWWWVARSTGVVAWALLSGSTVLGLLRSTRALGRRPSAAWVVDLHRFLAGLGLGFVGTHVVAIVLDSYVHFGIVDVVIPFTSTWHPVWVAGGIVAAWLLVVVELTSFARRSLPAAAWRRIHLLSVPAFALFTVHGVVAGTDTRSVVGVAAAIVASMVVVFLTTARAVGPPRPPEQALADAEM